jgi:hypothetical protein
MFAHMPLVAACAFVLIFSASAGAQTTDAPRRPSGPAASPAIKLPRGAGAAEQSAAAKGEGARVVAAPQKWEYCAIVDFERRQKGFSLSSPYVTVAVVRYFPNNTEEIEGASVDDALANALAKLGDDGWELVAVKVEFNLTEGNGKSSPTYYFKRPKRQE